MTSVESGKVHISRYSLSTSHSSVHCPNKGVINVIPMHILAVYTQCPVGNFHVREKLPFSILKSRCAYVKVSLRALTNNLGKSYSLQRCWFPTICRSQCCVAALHTPILLPCPSPPLLQSIPTKRTTLGSRCTRWRRSTRFRCE